MAVIDSSVRLYGLVFPRVAHKHRLQMLQHFIECIKQAKSVRQQAVQMNIFTSVLCALKVGFRMNEDKEYNYDASLTESILQIFYLLY